MTTIVIDCKAGVVAADGQITSHSCNYKGEVISHTTGYKDARTKVYKTEYGVFAGAGDADAIDKEREHYNKYGYLSGKPTGEFTIALVRRKGTHLHVDIHLSDKYRNWMGKVSYKMTTRTVVCDTSYITLGSGGNYAYAGMKMGLSAQKAIELASQCDQYTNNNIVCVTV